MRRLWILAAVLLAGCGVNSSIFVNQNQVTTQVQLSSANYRVVDRVSGSAEVEYILFIGGMRQTKAYQNAYFDMVTKANLAGGAKALANVVSEEHVGGVPPFYYKRTITFSAQVIEFTK